MRTNNKMIIKHIVPVTTTFGCYADDLWIIPLQINRTKMPDVYENVFVDTDDLDLSDLESAEDITNSYFKL